MLPDRRQQILLFTILGGLLCGLLNLFAHTMAREDLRRMDQRTMFDDNRGSVAALKTVNFVLILFWIVGVILVSVFATSSMVLWN